MNNSFAITSARIFLLAALTFMGYALAIKFPLLGTIAIPLCGIPAFISLLSYGFGYFILYVILTTFATMTLVKASALMLFPLVFMPALFLAGSIKLGMKPLNALCVALLSATVFSTGTALTILPSTTNAEIEQQRAKMIEQTQQVFEKQLDTALVKNPDALKSIEKAKHLANELFETILMLFPATIFFISHLIALSAIYGITYLLADRLGLKIESLPAFKDWQFDWKIVWFYIIGILCARVLANNQMFDANIAKLMKTIGVNCLTMSNIIYYIAGMSLLFFMFDKYQTGVFTRVSISFLALVLPQIVIWFAIIDIWAEFRKPKTMQWTSGSDDSDSDLFY